jgi:lipopolysaccharide transport system permease protein
MPTADLTASDHLSPPPKSDPGNPMTTTAGEPDAPDDSRPVIVIGPPTVSLRMLAGSARRLVQYRDLLYTLTVHRLQVRYKQSALGWLWAIVQPLSLMLMYTVIFWKIVRVDTGSTPYPLFAFSALLVWSCFSTAVAAATNSLVSHFGLVTKVYFPREILPLTYVLASLVDLFAGGLVLAAMMLYFHVPLTLHALHVVPAVAILVIFALAVSLVLCAVQVKYRDIGIAMPLVLQLWMFATPVVYPLRAVPPAWQPFYVLNPMVGVTETFRRALLEGATPHYQPLVVAAIVSLLVLPMAYLYFKRVEATVADIL